MLSKKTAVLKFIKGALGGTLIFVALRLGLGREVGWPEVHAFQGLIEGVIVCAFGLFEAVWGIVKFFREKAAEEKAWLAAGGQPTKNFTSKDGT